MNGVLSPDSACWFVRISVKGAMHTYVYESGTDNAR